MAIKAIAVDIDGTLTDERKVLSTRGVEALRRVQERGTTVCLVSGNVLPIAYGLKTYMGLDGPVVAENGGIVCHGTEVVELFDITLPRKALELLKANMDVQELFTSRWRRTEVAVERWADMERIKELLDGWELTIERTGFAIHIMNAGDGKGLGVKKMAELLGIDTEEIAAFGDSDNDVSMFRQCGFSVAVGNASAAAKAAASHVSRKEHAEGVIEGLEMLGLL
jgi:phosphoglycolate phosphatase (TIGR01487 family)